MCTRFQVFVSKMHFDRNATNSAQVPSVLCLGHIYDNGKIFRFIIGASSRNVQSNVIAHNPHLSPQQITIPAVFITMNALDTIAASQPQLFMSPTAVAVGGPGISGVADVSLRQRWRPWVNLSSVLMWALGCLTVFYGSWASCDDVRRATRANRFKLDSAADDRFQGDQDAAENEAPPLELTAPHAVGFIVVASGVLLVLFYVDLYLLVTVLFCVSASTSVAQVVLRPLLGRALGAAMARRQVCSNDLLGAVSALDASSNALGAALALTWFVTRQEWEFAFLLQDTFGCCLCVLFLGTIRLPSLRVASLLLCMAFFYDIFFVFISPLLFNESVMVKVATGTTNDTVLHTTTTCFFYSFYSSPVVPFSTNLLVCLASPQATSPPPTQTSAKSTRRRQTVEVRSFQCC
jgi:hypothetical protein